MPKLNDTHLMLLAHAANQEGGSLYPLPTTMLNHGSPNDRAAKAIEQLTGRGLIEEREINTSSQICRTDGDIGYGKFVKSVGLAAIGVEDTVDTVPSAPTEPDPDAVPPVTGQVQPRVTKAVIMLTLLQRGEGATLDELIEVTGWLPHTTRAALTGLRKKGHAIERGKRGDITCYKVTAA